MVEMTRNNFFYLRGHIQERKRMGPLYHRLRIVLPQPIGPIIPGQFAMLKIEGEGRIILPRPFSIHNFEGGRKGSWLNFLFKVVGKGTSLLAKLPVTSPVMVLAPLGKGFPDPPTGHKALLIAGGMGIAPLFPLALRLKASPSPPSLFYGAKSHEDLVCLSEVTDMEGIKIKTATEDGTGGEKGVVTDLLRNEDDEERSRTVIYACGPEPMLQNVARFATERKVPCWISLERRMACGLGACLGCVVETQRGYKKVCSDGPVFEANDIIWNDDAEP